MRRIALVVVCALAAALLPAAPAVANVATVVDAVTFDVKEDPKTITVTVRLTIASDCGPSRMAARDSIAVLRSQCHVTPRVAEAIEEAILEVWKGLTYQCYQVVFDIDIQVDDSPTPQPANDRLMVRLDRSAANQWNWVSVVGRNLSWDSNDPAARLMPTNREDGAGSTWTYPEPEGSHVFAHEFGHVLGLHEGYETVTGADGRQTNRERPGAPRDVMTNESYGSVAQSTIDRVIERSVDPSKIKCDYKIDTMVDWYHFEALKCAGADGQWDILVGGVYELGGGRLVLSGTSLVVLSKDPAGLYLGPWDAQFRIDLEGVPAAIGGQEGTLQGEARFDGEVLDLHGIQAEGEFWAQTPALALGGAAQDPKKDFSLPVENDRFC